jgi:molybdopterin synthase catalytic subunit
VTVRVKLFAILRDRAGVGEVALELPEGSTASQATGPLLEKLPSLRSHLDRCGYAINFSYVNRDAVLRDGDELALIPPVSGG